MLGNLPYVGTLFRNHNDGTTRNEVIILITPHIIRSEVDEAVSRQLRDDAERIRMGQRNGLQWWSSERMAMSYLRKAKQRLREGDRQRAMWDVDMALSIRPRLMEAIDLKEQLTQKAFWADEIQAAPTRYVVERMVMQDLGKCYKMVIPPNRPLRQGTLPEDVRKRLGIQPEICPPLPKSMFVPKPSPGVSVEVEVPAGAKPKPAVEAPEIRSETQCPAETGAKALAKVMSVPTLTGDDAPAEPEPAPQAESQTVAEKEEAAGDADASATNSQAAATDDSSEETSDEDELDEVAARED